MVGSLVSSLLEKHNATSSVKIQAFIIFVL